VSGEHIWRVGGITAKNPSDSRTRLLPTSSVAGAPAAFRICCADRSSIHRHVALPCRRFFLSCRCPGLFV